MARIQSKRFTFYPSSFANPVCRLEVATDHSYRPRVYEPTEVTYNRFVNLANNGQYEVEILLADYGVAWSLTRIEYAPKPHDFDGPADPYASPLANPHQCQVEPDGQILFA
jgi:hypothetical protein